METQTVACCELSGFVSDYPQRTTVDRQERENWKELCQELEKIANDSEMKHKFQETEKQLHNLQKDHVALKTIVDNLKGQREQEGNADIFGDIRSETSRADEALVSELRLQLQQVATLRESLQREKEKTWMAQQEIWEDEKARLMNRVNELSEEKTRILAMYKDEKEKTAKLEKNAEETSREIRNELWRRDQEKQETERHYYQQLEHWRQREDEALHRISELTETKEQLETQLKEAHEKDKEQCLKEGQWKEAREKLLEQIELLTITNKLNKSKKESRGFFSKIFGRSH